MLHQQINQFNLRLRQQFLKKKLSQYLRTLKQTRNKRDRVFASSGKRPYEGSMTSAVTRPSAANSESEIKIKGGGGSSSSTIYKFSRVEANGEKLEAL